MQSVDAAYFYACLDMAFVCVFVLASMLVTTMSNVIMAELI